MSLIKSGLISLLIGVGLLALVFGFVVFCSSDMRGAYMVAALPLLLGSLWFGLRGNSWLDAILLCLPLELVFGIIAVPRAHPLWLNLVLWPIAVLVGFYLGRARNSRPLAILSFCAFVAISIWFCTSYLPAQIAKSLSHYEDSLAPAFQLVPVSGTDVPTSTVSGKILVIDFFATWCAPCIAELPELSAARNELRDRPEIQFVVVASDAGRDTPQKFKAFADKKHLDLPLAFDPGGQAQAAFGRSGFPTLIVIDRAGHTRLIHQGYNGSETNFRRDLVRLLRSL